MGAPGEPLRPYAARLPLSPLEWACVAFAAIVAFGFFGHELALSVRVGRDPVLQHGAGDRRARALQPG